MTLDDRLALASQILHLEYPAYNSAWLKAIAVDGKDRISALRSFLADEFPLWTPEHAPYHTFNSGTWSRVDDAEMTARTQEILRRAASSVAAGMQEETDERSEAEEHGYLIS